MLRGVVLLLALSAPAAAQSRAPCRVFIEGDYRLAERPYTRAGCERLARRALIDLLCVPGVREFDFKFMFDGRIHTGTSRCGPARR